MRALPAVSIAGVCKTFRLPHQQYHTLKERVLHPFRSRAFDELHAVRDVSVDIAPGEFFQKGFLSPLCGETPAYWGTRFEPVDGDVEVADGVRIIAAPGHTPGSQAVLVQTAAGVYAIAGDAIFLYENAEKGIPPGYHWRIDESMASMRRILRESDHLLPSHDYAVFARGSPARFP